MRGGTGGSTRPSNRRAAPAPARPGSGGCWCCCASWATGNSRRCAGGLAVDGDEYPVSHAWQHVPVHLLGPGIELDRRNPGVAGAARAPQAMVQKLLNRTEEHLWAVLSNGLRLWLLRHSTALAGSAYVEIDLDRTGEPYQTILDPPPGQGARHPAMDRS